MPQHIFHVGRKRDLFGGASAKMHQYGAFRVSCWKCTLLFGGGYHHPWEGRSRGSYLEQFTKLLLDLPIPNLTEPYQPTFLYFTEYWISYLPGIIFLGTKNTHVRRMILHGSFYTHTLIVLFQGQWKYIKQACMWYRSQRWSHSWRGQKQWQLINSPNSLPKWMSDLWTMQNQSTVQDLKKNTFFQSWEWCSGLADPTHKCPALSINRNQPAQLQLLECRAFGDKKRSSAKDTEDAVDGPDCWTQRGSLCTIPLKPRTIGLVGFVW